MNNDHHLNLVSEKFYQFLCNKVVGSEKVVRYRRLYFKVLDEIWDTTHTSLITSGSKAEGLDLPGSDVDLMILPKSLKIYEHFSKSADIFIDTENAQPGFALLRISEKLRLQLPYATTYTDNGCLFSNKYWKELLFALFQTNFPKDYTCGILSQIFFHIQGPSLAISFYDIDLVCCFQCNSWPSNAGRWLFRNRSSGWPTSSLIEDAVHLGVLVVPVGSKFSSNEGNELEWRLSFSLPERVLIHSFNHTQLLCYALLKILLKEIINKNHGLAKLLCSYYIKTTMFWVMEELNLSFWVPKNLIKCFRFCIQRLQLWILCNYIPNYFLPEHNLIDGRLTNASRDRLHVLFDALLSRNGWKCLLFASSLQNFKLDDSIDAENTTSARRKAIYPILESSQSNFNKDLVAKVFARALNRNIPKFARSLYVITFSPYISRIATEIMIEAKGKNKNCYKHYKKCMSYLLIGRFGDAAAGWLVLAAFFFACQEYQKSLSVLRIVSEKLGLGPLNIDMLSPLRFANFPRMKSLFNSKSFLRRFRYEVVNTDTFIFTMFRSLLQHPDLHAHCFLSYLQELWHAPPAIILHYLTFVCQLRKRNQRKCQILLGVFRETVENYKYPNQISRLFSYLYLKKAYELSLSNSCFLTYLTSLNALLKIYDKLIVFNDNFIDTITKDKMRHISYWDIQL